MLFNEFLIKWKYNNQFPHSLIVNNINCCNLKEIAKNYLKSLVCKQNLFCDNCDVCKRINEETYVDFIYLSNDDESIVKDDINNIQKLFNDASTELSGIKLYVIKNIEYANKHVLNSLLKFLEEPPKNTYALFFSKDIYSILPTIRSRSFIIRISDKQKIDENSIYEKIFKDYEEYLKSKENYDLENIYNIANDIIKCNNEFNELKINNEVKKISKYEFSILIDMLIEMVPIEQKQKFIEYKKGVKLNMNKNSSLIKLFSLFN